MTTVVTQIAELKKLGLVKDFKQQKIVTKVQLDYIKNNSQMLSLIVQFYEFIINELEKDEYNDEITITKKD